MSAHMYCANIYIEFENSPQHNYGRRLTPTVLGHVEFGKQLFFGGTYPNIERAYLILKPLSSISDEDAIDGAIILQGIKKDNEILDIKRYDDFISFSIIHNGCNFKTCYSFFYQASKPATLSQKYVDFLRSRGYALPFMGLSVEELVDRGWVKLKGETKE